jgi:hypothetical protein
MSSRFFLDKFISRIDKILPFPLDCREIASVNDNCESVLIFLCRYKRRLFIHHFVETNSRNLSDFDVQLINRTKDSIETNRAIKLYEAATWSRGTGQSISFQRTN